MKIKGFLLLFVFLLTCSVGVCAAPVDLEADGSVTVNIIYKDAPVGGGTLTLFRVADLDRNNEEYVIDFTGDFENADLPVTDLNTQAIAKQYADYAQANNLQGFEKSIDENGVVVFSEIPVGLYLVARHECPLGYATIAPFLVTVPLEVAGETVYDVDASPKVSFVYDISQGERPDNPDPPDDNPDTPADPSTPDDSEKIPQTGQLKWPIPLLAVVGMLSILAGWRLSADDGKVSR